MNTSINEMKWKKIIQKTNCLKVKVWKEAILIYISLKDFSTAN